MQKKAAVDIGSNSIRYLGPNGERRLITTRLAENIISTGKLSDAAIERSIAALKELAALAAAQGAKPYAYATSAVRDAKFGSRERFLALAEEIMPVRVLSGEEEAAFARIGAGIADQAGLGPDRPWRRIVPAHFGGICGQCADGLRPREGYM